MPNHFDYLNIKPITGPIPPKKQEAKRHYGVHPYFTRRSYNVVQAYIRNFTQPGDLVVDPFGGSGVTAIKALVLRRRAIHLDINPLANFITHCGLISPVDIEALKEEYRRIEREVKPYLDSLDALEANQIGNKTVIGWYPQGVSLPSNADRSYVHELFSPRQLRALAYLRSSIQRTEDTTIRYLLLYVFSATLTKCNILFSGAKGRAQTRGNTSPIQLYRYWVPVNPVELGVWGQFKSKFAKFLTARKEINEVIGNDCTSENASILQGDASILSNLIGRECADYIYTDPPYGAHIAYLDLSTMWNAWLDFPVTYEDRIAEVIEDGELHKTKEDYTDRLRQSIHEIFKVLKFDRWFSLVFAHKDPLYWDTIIKAAEKCGFEYVNTSVVKAGIVSYHKHKNPLRVLSGEMVINFLKKKHPRSLAVTKVGVDSVQFVLDSSELSIVSREGGATTDQIHEDLIPKLIETGLLSELRDKIADITPLLGQRFDFNQITGRWVIPPNTKLGSFIPVDLRIRFYIEAFLNNCARKETRATLEDIWADVIPKLKNGTQPAEQELSVELERIAEPYQGIYYRLKSAPQGELFEQKAISSLKRGAKGLPEWNPLSEEAIEHDEIIYHLALICQAIGLSPYIGLNERSHGDYAVRLARISLPTIPRVSGLSRFAKKKVEQIDLIWFDDVGYPAYAFEVEKSTAITTAIDRFIELLKASLQVGGRAVIVCPSSRSNKLTEILSESHYIGAPMYMENKIRYLFFSDVVDLYNTCYRDALTHESVAVELRKRARSPLDTLLRVL